MRKHTSLQNITLETRNRFTPLPNIQDEVIMKEVKNFKEKEMWPYLHQISVKQALPSTETTDCVCVWRKKLCNWTGKSVWRIFDHCDQDRTWFPGHNGKFVFRWFTYSYTGNFNSCSWLVNILLHKFDTCQKRNENIKNKNFMMKSKKKKGKKVYENIKYHSLFWTPSNGQWCNILQAWKRLKNTDDKILSVENTR